MRNFNKRSFAVQALQYTKKKFKKMLQRRTIEDRGRSLMADQARTPTRNHKSSRALNHVLAYSNLAALPTF
jgi:hypothetical protein